MDLPWASVALGFGVGWGIRGLAVVERPAVPVVPCSCHCGCQCISSIGIGTWIGVAVTICLVVGSFVALWFVLGNRPKEETFQSPVKGKKGAYGVSGKVLTLTG